MRIYALVLLGAVVCNNDCLAQGDVVKGEESFEVCSVCHGERAEGSEDFGAPRLNGQHGWYLTTQLKNFRAGVRGSHKDDENGQVMQPMAEELDDQAISDLVAYIRTLEPASHGP